MLRAFHVRAFRVSSNGLPTQSLRPGIEESISNQNIEKEAGANKNNIEKVTRNLSVEKKARNDHIKKRTGEKKRARTGKIEKKTISDCVEKRVRSDNRTPIKKYLSNTQVMGKLTQIFQKLTMIQEKEPRFTVLKEDAIPSHLIRNRPL
jgi:hypothetical protein